MGSRSDFRKRQNNGPVQPVGVPMNVPLLGGSRGPTREEQVQAMIAQRLTAISDLIYANAAARLLLATGDDDGINTDDFSELAMASKVAAMVRLEADGVVFGRPGDQKEPSEAEDKQPEQPESEDEKPSTILLPTT